MTNKNDKQCNITLGLSVSSWVYIVYNTLSKDLCIGLSYNFPKQFSCLDKNEKMVYYRRYINSFDALAHKHILEHLSDESIIHNIKQVNPRLSNLSLKNINYL